MRLEVLLGGSFIMFALSVVRLTAAASLLLSGDVTASDFAPPMTMLPLRAAASAAATTERYRGAGKYEFIIPSTTTYDGLNSPVLHARKYEFIIPSNMSLSYRQQ